MTRIGFAGLGRMGSFMAANLARAGFDMYVWNRSSDPARRFEREFGSVWCETPRELAESVDAVVTMLADDEAARQVLFARDGVFEADRGAGQVVMMGTHSPRLVRELAQSSDGRMVIDAPVSGSIDAARDAELLIMAGATRSEAEPLEPMLAAMSREVVYLGMVGAGAAMKLAVNLLIHSLNQAVAESLVLAEGAGIDTRTAYRVLEGSAAAAPMLTYRRPQYLDADLSPVSFALRLARKDVALAVDLAEDEGVFLPQAEVNLRQLEAAEVQGFAERDMAAILHLVRGDA
jgi:3-hydroxyisobutyrate dehydrogenase